MMRSLCPDRTRASIATLAAVLALLAPVSFAQVSAIVLGALAGLRFCRASPGAAVVPVPLRMPVPRRAGVAFLGLFAALLVLPLLPGLGMGLALFDAFYRSGALVFGGGHVVLPLLRDAVVTPGWVPDDAFLAGYGAGQAVPGPLFTFAAYLGAVVRGALGRCRGAARDLPAGDAAA